MKHEPRFLHLAASAARTREWDSSASTARPRRLARNIARARGSEHDCARPTRPAKPAPGPLPPITIANRSDTHGRFRSCRATTRLSASSMPMRLERVRRRPAPRRDTAVGRTEQHAHRVVARPYICLPQRFFSCRARAISTSGKFLVAQLQTDLKMGWRLRPSFVTEYSTRGGIVG